MYENKIQSLRKEKGITLIALIITIVILIILAVVSINAIFGDNGLIKSAEKGKLEHEIAATRERLELVLADAYTEKHVNEKYNQDEFLDEFIYAQEPDAEEEEVEISLNGHTFELDRSVPELGDYIGEAGNLPPTIRKIEVIAKTDTSATIEVTAARTEGVKYKYSIKKQNEGDENYTQETTKNENTNEFTGLENTGTYTIYTAKVELIKDEKTVDEDTIEILMGKLEKGVVRFEDGKWDNGKASVQILTDKEGYRLQYQIDGIEDEKWIDIESGNRITGLTAGQTVYGRLWNGIDESDPASFEVKDTVNPTISEIKEVEKTETTIKIQVVAEDKESGIAKIEYSSNDGEEYTIGETATATEYTFTGLTELTEYTIKVRVTDGAGNTAELNKKIETDEIQKWDGQSNDKVEAVVSDDEVTVPVPHGFVASKVTGEKTVSGGFVIYEGDTEVNDLNVDNEITSRNQFVWIPVGDYTTMYTEATATLAGGTGVTTNVYSKLRMRSGNNYTITIPGDTSGIREPDIISSDSANYSILGYISEQDMANKMIEEYMATYKSIKKYEGFYIGRYELTGTVKNPTVQKGTVLGGNWYDLKKACTNIVNTSYAQTTMIYGNQWDEVMSWLLTTGEKNDFEVNIDSNSWGNYNSITRTTGYSESWKANNIYDLAGNYDEWTQEALESGYRIRRGGCAPYSGASYPASDRTYTGATSNMGYFSSRPTLYIK